MKKILKTNLNSSNNSRNQNVEFIKVLSCFAVVGLHTLPRNNSITTSLLYYLCGFAVPMFFMSSGYFLLNRGKVDYKYIFKKIIRIIKLIIVWNLLIIFLKSLKHLIVYRSINLNYVVIITSLFEFLAQKGFFWHFWYFGSLIFIYMLVPILSNISKEAKNILLIILGLTLVLIQALSLWYEYPLQSHVIQTFRIWTWLFYFLLGSKMKTIGLFFTKHLSLTNHFLLFLFLTSYNLIYQFYIVHHIIILDNLLAAEYFYDDFFEIIWILTTFSFLLRLPLSTKIATTISKIGLLTTGIYIIHPFILRFSLMLTGDTTIGQSLLYWSLTVLICLLLTWIINKFSIGKFLINI